MATYYRQNEKLVKWTQWDNTGMIRCGTAPYGTIMKWVHELGLDAKKCVMAQEKPHAIYAKKMHDESGVITEVRMYCDTYLTDDELDTIAHTCVLDTLYVAHK